MVIKFLETAQFELDESVEYYNREIAGLGIKFLEEVLRGIDLIANYPEAWPQISDRTRRCKINRFPFGIIYQNRGDEILIVAIAHFHRKPGYWNERLNQIK